MTKVGKTHAWENDERQPSKEEEEEEQEEEGRSEHEETRRTTTAHPACLGTQHPELVSLDAWLRT